MSGGEPDSANPNEGTGRFKRKDAPRSLRFQGSGRMNSRPKPPYAGRATYV